MITQKQTKQIMTKQSNQEDQKKQYKCRHIHIHAHTEESPRDPIPEAMYTCKAYILKCHKKNC